MVAFCLLVAPLPFKVRRNVFRFLSESVIVAKVAYALKISFMFVLVRVVSYAPSHTNLISRFVAILFVDALQRMFRVSAEADLAKSGTGGVQDVRTDTNIAARKF